MVFSTTNFCFLSSALLDCLVLPLQEKMEEWKKVAHSLDKEHSKEYKKLRQELKKKTDNQNRLVKKHNKKSQKSGDFDPKVEQSISDVTKSVRSLHEVEKSAVRRVLIEERSRYSTFVGGRVHQLPVPPSTTAQAHEKSPGRTNNPLPLVHLLKHKTIEFEFPAFIIHYSCSTASINK